jgi:hypothetical protein
MTLTARVFGLLASAAVLASSRSLAQPVEPPPDRPVIGEATIAEAMKRGVEIILSLQEGEGPAEWPYEGVYRVGGEIPIGYRVGGTAIAALALLDAPGYREDEARQAAVKRAAAFVAAGADHPLMSIEVKSTYDVRGWGYTYGLALLLRLRTDQLVPVGLEDAIERAADFYCQAIQKSEIVTNGGWNYARRSGFDQPAAPSPFMTGPTLHVLFEAKAQGLDVEAGVIERALQALEDARTTSGAFAYSGSASRERDLTPGAVGRMVCAEATLLLAGRSSVANVRGAIDAFIVHWDELEKRRAQHGTHAPPYGVAPYYFYFAHYYAARAVELLPERERPAYRRRLNELLFNTRRQDGSWNDRVFPRSANYGTAMAILSLAAPASHPQPTWRPVDPTSPSTAPSSPPTSVKELSSPDP